MYTVTRKEGVRFQKFPRLGHRALGASMRYVLSVILSIVVLSVVAGVVFAPFMQPLLKGKPCESYRPKGGAGICFDANVSCVDGFLIRYSVGSPYVRMIVKDDTDDTRFTISRLKAMDELMHDACIDLVYRNDGAWGYFNKKWEKLMRERD